MLTSIRKSALVGYCASHSGYCKTRVLECHHKRQSSSPAGGPSRSLKSIKCLLAGKTASSAQSALTPRLQMHVGQITSFNNELATQKLEKQEMCQSIGLHTLIKAFGHIRDNVLRHRLSVREI